MTRKDYVAIAAAIMKARADIRDKEPAEGQRDLLDGVSYAAEFIADAMAADNSRFDKARFLAAAGVDRYDGLPTAGTLDQIAGRPLER